MQPHAESNTQTPEDVVLLVNAAGEGGVILVCEHATNFIPDEYAGLGLGEEALLSHVAWDPGALAVALALSKELDAPLVAPAVSRLVYDCNRPLESESVMPEKSEIYYIPGNTGLSSDQRQARSMRFYQPYRHALESLVETSLKNGRHPAIITIHSFTPVFHGQERDLDLGILHDLDGRLAAQLIDVINYDDDLTARLNAPYSSDDGVTYTLSQHASPRRLLSAMIEIRNDLVADQEAQTAMAKRLASHISKAMSALQVDRQGGVES